MRLTTFTLFLFIYLLAATYTIAQVKIGDNPNTIQVGSLFELESTDKGFLPPRLPLSNITTWAPLAGTAVEGMVVYSDAGALQDGFYYWDGTQWVRLAGAQDAEWLDANISGRPLILARQAAATGDTVVVTDNGRLGIGTSNPLDLLHVQGAVTDEVRFSLSGVEDFRFGRNAGRSRIFSGNTLELQSNNATNGVMVNKNGGNPGDNTTVLQIGGGAIGLLIPTAKLFDANGKFVIQANGNTGIGKFLPTAKLHIEGTLAADTLLLVKDAAATQTFEIHPNRNIYFYPNQHNPNSEASMRGVHADGRWALYSAGYRALNFRSGTPMVGLGEGECNVSGINSAIAAHIDLNGDQYAYIPRLAISAGGAGPTNVSQLLIQRSDASEWQNAGSYPSGQNYFMIRTHLTNATLPTRRAPIQMGAYELKFNTGFSDNTRVYIDSTGELQFNEYPNTRDDAPTVGPQNILYTDVDGFVKSTSTATLADSINDHDWYKIGTTDAPDDINNFIYTQGRVCIGTTAASADLNVGGSQVISFTGTAPSSTLRSPGSLIINANSGNANITTRAEEFRFNGFDAGVQSTVNMRGIDANHVALTLGLNTAQTRNVMQITDDANLPVTVFDKEGHLGIGTAAPLGFLHVDNPAVYSSDNALVANSSIVLRGSVSNAVGDHFGGITWATNADRKRAGISSVMENVDADYVGLAFWTKGIDGPGPMSESMRISHSGNVGIGTTNPDEELEVNGEIEIAGGEAPDDTRINFAATDKSNRFQIETDLDVTTSLDRLGFRSVTNDNILVLTGTGRVGLGIIDPAARLHVTSGGSTANDYTAKFTSSPSVGGSGGIVFTNTEAPVATGFKWHTVGTGVGTFADDDLILSSITVASGATNANNIFTIQGNGNIGLGVLNSANPIQHSSGARLTAAGVWTNASDRRLKTNITTTQYGLATVMQLKPVDYTMKKGGEKQVGFIAQEVQAIIPELVDGKEGDLENGETLGVAYGQMVAVLTKAIQEQQAQIEQLQKQNGQLAEKNTELDKKNEHLETRVNEIDQLKAELSEIKNLLKSTSSNK